MNHKLPLLLLFFAGFAVRVIAQPQNLNFALGLGQVQFTKHLLNKGNPAFPIGITGLIGNVTEWSYRAPDGGQPSMTSLPTLNETRNIGHNLQAQFSGNTVTIINNGFEPTIGEIALELQARIGVTLISKPYRFVIRAPLAIVFVLDKSGSMDCGPNQPLGLAGWSGCTADDPDKWSMLRDGVDLFIDTLTMQNPHTKLDQDQFSVVYFAGSTEPSTIVGTTGPTAFLDRAAFSANLPADADAIRAVLGGGTSIGDGIQDAITNKFSSVVEARQIVVLVTDGQQNNELFLTGDGNNLEMADGTTVLSTRTDGSGEPVAYFCLALDADSHASSYGALLSNLTGGGSNFVVSDDLSASYSDDFAALMGAVFAGHSPQFIHKQLHLMTTDTIRQSFSVNADGSNLHFVANFKDTSAGRYRYFVVQNGIDRTTLAQQQVGSNAAALSIDFLQHPEINSRGQWEVIVVPGARQLDVMAQQTVTPQVTLSAIIDDHRVEVDYAFGANRLIVGDRVRPRVQLRVNNQAVEDAVITAQLIRPGADKGDLVARAQGIPHEPEPGSEVNNAFSVKYGHLQLNNPDYLAPLAPVSTTITLNPQGGGVYAGNFGDTEISDNHRIVFRIQAQHPELGEIIRYQHLTAAVRFGPLVHNLVPQEILTRKSDNGYVHTLTYFPAYQVNGQTRLVGPGYEHLYDLQAPPGTRLSGVVDNGDGSYTLTVTSDKKNPKTTFHLLDEPFYANRGIQGFDDPYSPYNTHLSLHGGITRPFDLLDSLYDGGYFAEMDLGFYLAPRMDLEVIGGYYQFKNDFSLAGASTNLRYNALQLGANNNTGLTFSGGIGAYKPSNENLDWGVNGRIGIQRQLVPQLTISLEGAYFLMPTPDYRWGTLGLALRWGL